MEVKKTKVGDPKKTEPKDTLLQRLANATKTYYGCGGHGKAARNESLMKRFTRELKESGEAVPTVDELLEMGVFNGKGAS